MSVFTPVSPEDARAYLKHYTLGDLESLRSRDYPVLRVNLGRSPGQGWKALVESVRAAGPRLLDMHIKDLADLKAKDSQVPVGDGAMPVVAIFKELKKMNYQGGVMLEYEVEADNPLPGMQKSFAYMRGVLAGLRG